MGVLHCSNVCRSRCSRLGGWCCPPVCHSRSARGGQPPSAPLKRPSRANPASSSPFPSARTWTRWRPARSEEHTSELQSRLHLVCRLLLEKKKKNKSNKMRQKQLTDD